MRHILTEDILMQIILEALDKFININGTWMSKKQYMEFKKKKDEEIAKKRGIKKVPKQPSEAQEYKLALKKLKNSMKLSLQGVKIIHQLASFAKNMYKWYGRRQVEFFLKVDDIERKMYAFERLYRDYQTARDNFLGSENNNEQMTREFAGQLYYKLDDAVNAADEFFKEVSKSGISQQWADRPFFKGPFGLDKIIMNTMYSKTRLESVNYTLKRLMGSGSPF